MAVCYVVPHACLQLYFTPSSFATFWISIIRAQRVFTQSNRPLPALLSPFFLRPVIRIENKNHPNTGLDALYLSDDAITVLTSRIFNHRLLSEMICHKDSQRMMLDAEIYVDRIADMRITNMNAAMEAVRQSVIKKKGNDAEDLGSAEIITGCHGLHGQCRRKEGPPVPCQPRH